MDHRKAEKDSSMPAHTTTTPIAGNTVPPVIVIMPNGSAGPGPLPYPANTASAHSSDDLADSSPPRKFLLTGPRHTASVDNVNMKAKIFGGPPVSPTTTRPKTGHQSIRGRISGPIPQPNPLDDDEFPMRNPGTGIASATPIENDLVLQRQLQQSASKPASPVTPGFAPAVAQTFPLPSASSARVDGSAIVDVPQTVMEHPSTPTQQPQPPSSSDPSPDGGVSSVSGARSSTMTKAHRANPSNSARYSSVSANSQKTGYSNPAADGQNGPPQRKKSTLRSAIGKLLGRRKKKEGSLSSVSEIDRQAVLEGPPPQIHHRSVSHCPHLPI